MTALTTFLEQGLTRRNRRRSFATLVMLLFLVYFMLPIFWLIVSSTKSDSQLFSTFGLWFAHFDLLQNLHQVFTYDGGIYLTWLGNTALYAVTAGVGAALCSTMAGYAFAKYRFRGRNVLFAVVLGSIMIPQTALVIPIYLLLSKVGIINTPFAVILPSLVSPIGVFLMRVYADRAVPDALLDAARVDGAGEFKIFRAVSFRILVPGFATVLLLSFVATWNNYFLPLVVLSTPKYYPLTVGLAQWNSSSSAGGGANVLFSIVVAGALVAVVPVAIAFLLLQRYWQGGLTAGGVK
ncbi:MAG TPA: carbohydrate ABC transporter permease [Solirubrobacteraceae bacterium]|nr:carbohydrate ABC transporter permease [Solirubrobacteraceae bacterium]